MSEEFLYGADVVAILEEVGCEGVAEGVGGDGLFVLGEFGGFSNGSLGNGFIEMVTADNVGTRVKGTL